MGGCPKPLCACPPPVLPPPPRFDSLCRAGNALFDVELGLALFVECLLELGECVITGAYQQNTRSITPSVLRINSHSTKNVIAYNLFGCRYGRVK